MQEEQRENVARHGLSIALAIDAVIPSFDRKRFLRLASDLGNPPSASEKVWSSRDIDSFRRLSTFCTGRGVDATVTRYTFPYSSVPAWEGGQRRWSPRGEGHSRGKVSTAEREIRMRGTSALGRAGVRS